MMSLDRPITVAVTGMNAVPENPGPGLGVARCLREAFGDRVRIIGLGYDALDPGCRDPLASYFVGYPWLSCRGSGIIPGVGADAERVATTISRRLCT